MKKILFTGLLLSALYLNCSAQDKTTQTPNKEEMKTYYMVFLKKGNNRSQDSATSAQIQKGHMEHLNKMYTEGRMCLAGPMLEDGDLRGICVYYGIDKEETQKWANEDPAVKSGRLVAEVHGWYAQAGSKLP